MKNKLLLLLNNFNLGGAERMVFELANNVDTERYDVEILCYGPRVDNFLSQMVESKFGVTYLDISGGITVQNIRKALKAINLASPNIVHAHMGGAGFAAIWALFHKDPVVITVHTKPDKAFSPKIEKLIRLALKRRSTTLVAVSEENLKKVNAYFGNASAKNRCVNNGITLSRFQQKTHSGFAMINVARQDENKNQSAILRCFKKYLDHYPEDRLYLVGDGPCHEELVEMSMNLGLSENVVFTGNVENTEDYYSVSDLYVQSSHREAMPLSLLEAMAVPMPIISTNVGGICDVVCGNGILVDDNDEPALLAAMLQVRGMNSEETNKLKERSLAIVADYSSEAMGKKYMELYDECINKNGKPKN